MYRLYLFVILLAFVVRVQSQNRPDVTVRPQATPVALPGAYSNTTINYIRTWKPMVPSTDTAFVASSSRKVTEVWQSTQYFDGLGRPLQTVSKGMSPAGKDLVGTVVYDAFGREQFKYLPYVQQSGNTSDGKFKTDPFNAQKAFYQNATLAPGGTGEAVYYSSVDYEASPLNRTLKTYAPGNSWAKNDPATVERGGNRPVETRYQLNATADSVRIWDFSGGAVIPGSAAGKIYGAGQLYKNLNIDEAGNQVAEYKDKEGKVVLKKVQLSATSGKAHMGWLCTYYVFDDLGNLRFVVPPKAVEAIISNWTITAGIAAELCFIYRYDSRNRMIIKKVPGADSTEMVYDVRDRLAFSRDGNMKGNNWLVTFYDNLNRPTLNALYSDNTSRDALQTVMNAATGNTQSIPYTFPGTADLVLASYDGTTSLYEATNSIWLTDGFDTGAGAGVSFEINASAINGSTIIAASNPFPNIPVNKLTPLVYTFYGDYTFTGKRNYVAGDITKPQAGSNLYAEALPATASTMVNGLVTGTRVRVLGTDQWLTTTSYYNDKGRQIQTISDNISGGFDVSTNLYDFNGKLLSSYLRHKNQRSGTIPQVTMLTMMTYDAGGRLLSVKKRLNDDVALERTVATNEYDELGQLKKKRLGVSSTTTQLETLNYDYNIRGWLKGINKDFTSTPGSTTNWFGQELSYNYGFSTTQFNGNIAGATWKSRGDGIQRAYGYSYDNVNRLTSGDFNQQNGSNWTNTTMNFSVSGLSYDANGNILFMNQKGMNGTQPQTIDSLKYSYSAVSNKLSFVTDRSNNPQSTLGDFKEINNNETIDYAYDANGNLTKDANKNIAAIRYNFLNLPDSIAIAGKGAIKYQYDASGNKQRKIVTDNAVTPAKITTTDYISGFVYENDTLQFLAHEEGRIRAILKSGQPVAYKYDYFIKDHLGNVRMVLTEQSDTGAYAATMESTLAPAENALFSNIDNTRAAKPVGYPADATTSPNDYVARLNAANGQKIGPSLVLRVMAGDTLQVGSKAFYKSTGASTSATTTANMLAALLQAFGGDGIRDGVHSATGAGSPLAVTFNNTAYDNLKQKDPSQNLPDKPKSYLNYALFDDQFNIVNENSGVKQVQGTPDALQTIATDKMIIKKTGFIYIYTSNESGQDVFFDNLVVSHSSGPLLEETHYYPFGLTMVGISSKAMGKLENRYGFNGIEKNNDFELNRYEAFYRTLDPQIGRFLQIDPQTTFTESLYNAMGNNPVSNNDWLGNYFTWSNQTLQDTYDLLRKENGNRIAGYTKELAGLDLNSKDSKVQGRIGQLTTLINKHGELNSQWNEMESSAVEFHVTDQETIAGARGGTNFDVSNKRVNVDLGKNGVNISTMAHEFRHGYAYLNGEMVGVKGTDPFYDIMDEVAAYNADFLFLDRNTANLVANGNYNLNWFKSTMGKNPLYSDLAGRDEQLTTNSSVASFIKYNPGARISFVLGFKNNANITLMQAINILNETSQKLNNKPEYYTGQLLNNK